MSRRVIAKDLLSLLLYYPGRSVLNRVPRMTLEPLARRGGDVVRRLSEQGEMEAELAVLFGERPLPAPARDIVRRAYRLAMLNELEVLRYPRLDPRTIDDACVIEGRAHLDRALERGRGAIILIGHFGANQMVMPALGHKGYPMNQLSAPPPVWAEILQDSRSNPIWEAVLARRWELEQRLPVRHINVFRFLRPAFACLANNEVLGLAFDGGGGRGWTQVQLLARTANVSTQPVQLWRKSGAALLPAVVVRAPGQRRHRLVIEPELPFVEYAERAEEDRINLQAFVDRFSAWVEAFPDHYLQFVLLRKRVRGTDLRPFFEGWPPATDTLSEAEAEERLARAGAWRQRQ